MRKYAVVILCAGLCSVFFFFGYYISAHAQVVLENKLCILEPINGLFTYRKEVHQSINPAYYEHTHILATAAGLLVILILGWVYLQNYLYKEGDP